MTPACHKPGQATALGSLLTLVTGAAGFIGRHTCQALLAAGRPVRGLCRSGRVVLGGVAQVIGGDLCDREVLRRAVQGVHAVVHLAARVNIKRETESDPLRQYRRVNVEGTRLLLEEAIAAGVREFVFVSSVGASDAEDTTTLTDDSLPAPEITPYARSKLEAEKVVRSLADYAGIHAPILRPPLVYGPGMKGSPLRLFDLIARGIPLPLGSVKCQRSFVYVGNLVAAILALLGSSAAGRDIFFVNDGHDLSTPEFTRAIANALGKPARLISISPAVLRLAGRAGDVISRFIPFPLTSDAVNRLFGSLIVDVSKLSRVTGFRAPYSVEEGLRLTAEWYRVQRMTKA